MQDNVIDLWGERIDVPVPSASTRYASCAVIQTSPPGGGPMAHQHSREDEVLVVLEGDYAFYDGETWRPMQPGHPLFAVRDRPHAYRNVGTTTGRMMVVAAPGGLDTYFEAVAQLVLPRDRDRFEDISRHYGITVLPPESVPAPDGPAAAHAANSG